jgi:hypothetical protein
MGSGSYSINSLTGDYDSSIRANKAALRGIDYSKASRSEIFKSRSMNNAMSPYDVDIRESRDSEEHPNSLAIIIALDVTGSMGTIPHYLIKNGLPDIMGNLIQRGIKDPQVMFLAIGDHECDNAPLQVSQFESSDELLDHWLETVWLEGNGGGNEGESYFLAWYFAGNHTSIDCFEKRGQKGFLFTIGDEPNLKTIPGSDLKDIMGKGQYDTKIDTSSFLEKARKTYNVKHLHLTEGYNGRDPDVIDGWKQIMRNDLITVNYKEDIAKTISDEIIFSLSSASTDPGKPADPKPVNDSEEQVIL